MEDKRTDYAIDNLNRKFSKYGVMFEELHTCDYGFIFKPLPVRPLFIESFKLTDYAKNKICKYLKEANYIEKVEWIDGSNAFFAVFLQGVTIWL